MLFILIKFLSPGPTQYKNLCIKTDLISLVWVLHFLNIRPLCFPLMSKMLEKTGSLNFSVHVHFRDINMINMRLCDAFGDPSPLPHQMFGTSYMSNSLSNRGEGFRKKIEVEDSRMNIHTLCGSKLGDNCWILYRTISVWLLAILSMTKCLSLYPVLNNVTLGT